MLFTQNFFNKNNFDEGFPVIIWDLQDYHYDALRDLIPFVQFRKHGKHPWRSVTFSKVAGFNLQLY